MAVVGLLEVSQNARAVVAAHPFARRMVIRDNKEWQTGPRGFALCRWCGNEVPNKRRCYCDEKCVHEFMLRLQPSYVRDQVFKRDGGICLTCLFDTEKVKRKIYAMSPQYIYTCYRTHGWSTMDEKHRKLCRKYIALGFPDPHLAWWNADHILPVVEGGGLCGLENYRTLCIPCHAQETRSLAGRRKRRVSNHPSANLQTGLL